MGERLLSSTRRITDSTLSAETRWVRRVALGARIRNARVASRMTRVEFAHGLTSVAYLSRIEAGERQPSPVLLENLACRLGVEVEKLTPRGSRTPEGLRFELAHADLLLASGHLDDAIRVSADLADVATCIGLIDVADAASVVRASALAATGRHGAALRILRPLTTGPISLPAMVAQARSHLALSRYRRAIVIGQRAADQIAARNHISLPAAADLAVIVCEAYAAIGEQSSAAQVAGLALKHLRTPTAEEESAFAPVGLTLTGIPFRSFEQVVRQTEISVAGLQASKLRNDVATLATFAEEFSSDTVLPIHESATQPSIDLEVAREG